jgi:acetolactate synthase-1/2/3 large subunit
VANGLFHGEPYDLGISGGFASPTAADLISHADLIVAFGCALNMWTMRHGRLIATDAVVAQVDLDPAALGAHRPIDLGVVGDSAATAEELVARLGPPRPGYRNTAVEIRRWNDEPIDDLSTSDRVDPRILSRDLDAVLPAERIVAIDSGNFMGYPSAYLRVPDEFGFCFTQAFQSIGLGLSTAIGAALARPDRLPILATGDGGFLMSIAELETAVRLGLPLLCVVYNDAAYGAEVHHFGTDVDLGTVTFPDTDIAAVATGFGAQGLTVRHPDDLGGVSDWLASSPTGPLVVDAKIVSDGGSWWLAEAFKGH